VIRWTRNVLSDDNYKWLYSLPYTKIEGEIGFFHGAPIMPSGFFYVVQTQEAQAHCQVFSRLMPINFIGHAHLTHIFQISQKKAKPATASQVTLAPDTKFIVNCGSVGQPRDKDPRACYVLWDSDALTVDFVRVEYDIDTAAKKIVSAGLDEKFAKRLYLGV
jgi:diadenosine tetraphosphatase ApaH/serine/threonine PP2A family protein phosphatase